MPRALILADDLTGASDAGVAFGAAGLSTIVSLGGAMESVAAEVFSVDADTRRLQADDAAARVEGLVLQLAVEPGLLLFKKIDSTLRGHVAMELAAALQAYRSLHPGPPRPVAVCAPAFPSLGRTTVQGTQHMHGDPLHQTELWRLHEMSFPAYLPGMLRAAGLHVALISHRASRATQVALAEAMRRAADTADVLVCDAETDEDLRAIAVGSMGLNRRAMLVGSGGLAHQLANIMRLGDVRAVGRPAVPPLSGPLLFVVGSLSHRSLEQMQVLTASSPTLHIVVPTDILLSGAGCAAWDRYKHQLEEAIERGGNVLLSPGSEITMPPEQRPRLSASLAQLTLSVRHRVGGLFAAGGETARSVLQSWQVKGLRLLGEVERGVPVAVTESWERTIPVVTKAGDFGSPETMMHCRRFLQGKNEG